MQLQLLALTEPGGDWLCGWHAEQLAPAAVQCVFAGHVSQAVDSSTRCAVPCLPAAHAVHEWFAGERFVEAVRARRAGG